MVLFYELMLIAHKQPQLLEGLAGFLALYCTDVHARPLPRHERCAPVQDSPTFQAEQVLTWWMQACWRKSDTSYALNLAMSGIAP
jgi:hypothetical protein